jgi:multiple antibiotic resistance protein
MNNLTHIFAILFLMLGPFKIIAPFMQLTAAADHVLTRRIAFRAIIYSTTALLVAGLLGQNLISKYGIPISILALSGGLILFLVAILNVIRQFNMPSMHEPTKAEPPDLKIAINPLAFPTIVTPYGIAAVIVFLAVSPELERKLAIGAMVMGIMALNLVFMVFSKMLIRILAFILPLLAAILGVLQVALGLQIIYRSVREILKSFQTGL